MEYEGEYLYNKKYNGKGFDKNGNIIYELINGNVKVKEYGDNGILILEGEYLNRKRKEKEKYDNDDKNYIKVQYLNYKRVWIIYIKYFDLFSLNILLYLTLLYFIYYFKYLKIDQYYNSKKNYFYYYTLIDC